MTEVLSSPPILTSMAISTLRVDVVDGPDAESSCDGTNERLTIGTARGNDLVLSDPTVSRFHMEAQPHPSGFLVTDCGSTNGTYAGDIRIERAFVPAGQYLGPAQHAGLERPL